MSQYFNIGVFASFREKKTEDDAKPEGNDDSMTGLSVPQTSSTDRTLPPVDGFQGWMVVVASFLAHLTVLGLFYAFGVFVVPISEEYGVSRASVSLVGTINVAFFYGAGTFSGPLSDRFGVRPVIVVGTIFWVVGAFLASVTTAFWQQIITQGIMLGLGTSFVYWPAISVVPQWFDKYRGSAVGVAALGAGLGNLTFALGGQKLISTLGWRNSLRVLGGIGAALLIVVIILVKRRAPLRRQGGLFDKSKELLRLPSYRWFLLATFFFQWGFFVPFVHIAAYTKDLGIDDTMQGLAVAFLGVGSSVGRVATGPLGDKIGRMRVFRFSMFASSITLACWPACKDIGSILTFAFFYSFFAGGFIAQSPVIAGDLWGVNNLGGTFALVNLVMIPGGLACGPIAGEIFERYGSYNGAIWGAAFFLFVSSSLLLLVRKSNSVETSATSSKPQESLQDGKSPETALAPSPRTAAHDDFEVPVKI